MKQNERFRLWRDIVWLTQLGFSMVSPLLLCIWGGWQLQHRFGFGPWVMAAAIVLGLGGAARHISLGASGAIEFSGTALAAIVGIVLNKLVPERPDDTPPSDSAKPAGAKENYKF